MDSPALEGVGRAAKTVVEEGTPSLPPQPTLLSTTRNLSANQHCFIVNRTCLGK